MKKKIGIFWGIKISVIVTNLAYITKFSKPKNWGKMEKKEEREYNKLLFHKNNIQIICIYIYNLREKKGPLLKGNSKKQAMVLSAGESWGGV